MAATAVCGRRRGGAGADTRNGGVGASVQQHEWEHQHPFTYALHYHSSSESPTPPPVRPAQCCHPRARLLAQLRQHGHAAHDPVPLLHVAGQLDEQNKVGGVASGGQRAAPLRGAVHRAGVVGEAGVLLQRLGPEPQARRWSEQLLRPATRRARQEKNTGLTYIHTALAATMRVERAGSTRMRSSQCSPTHPPRRALRRSGLHPPLAGSLPGSRPPRPTPRPPGTSRTPPRPRGALLSAQPLLRAQPQSHRPRCRWAAWHGARSSVDQLSGSSAAERQC